jgi:hypothetical protein
LPQWPGWFVRLFFLAAGRSSAYHILFGVKILLALHVFAVAILIAAPKNPRRARQMFGAAVSTGDHPALRVPEGHQLN